MTMKYALLKAGIKDKPLGTKVICGHCGNTAERVTGKEVYPHRKDLYGLIFHVCYPCDARVGCHPNTDKPLGGLATQELRTWRVETHNQFDKLWKSKSMSRSKAYYWLRDKMVMNKRECHIGKFNVIQCKEAIKYCKDYLKEIQ